MDPLRYFAVYPPGLQQQVRELIDGQRLDGYLQQRYPGRHQIRSDKALYDYAMAIKQQYLRSAPSPNKVVFQNRLDAARTILGLNTAISRVQGGRLKASREIRVASFFKDAPPEFLEMVVVHELAHLREFDHGKAFYSLCCHMLPDYHQIEFDLRLYLVWHQRQLGAAPAPD